VKPSILLLGLPKRSHWRLNTAVAASLLSRFAAELALLFKRTLSQDN
jgi:hypothetical protein